jgi:alpha-mannosidase
MNKKARTVVHLLPNAHLDPVWLWDWREGLNEGIITVRTILNLMDEFPELTFIRGESSIYKHIEENDPSTFKRLQKQVEQGRWDIVGGTYNQPDTNLAAAETLCRQYEVGLGYFQSRFGFRPTVAWQADSFGHTPGLPNIMRSFGMDGFMFTRPNRQDFPMRSPAFWWECDHGGRILCYRQHYVAYCSERHNLAEKLDLTLKESSRLPLRNVALLMGLGNHGGGPSRRHILDARAWARRHPEVELRFSTFHAFFRDLRREAAAAPGRALPSLKGDLGFCLRGCYSSVAKMKFAYRRAEALLEGAEITQSLVRHRLPGAYPALEEAWEGVLFNSFHDILPGSSIERAFDDQLAWVGKSFHEAQKARFHALNRLAAQIDTRVPAAPAPDKPLDVPHLVWNPLPRPVTAWVELESPLDYRPDFKVSAAVGSLPLRLAGPRGEKPAFQEIPTEHLSMRNGAWRKRVVFQTQLPALGWKVFRMGREEGAPGNKIPKTPEACAAGGGKLPFIRNRLWKIQVHASGRVRVTRGNRPFLGKTGLMDVLVFEDIWGSWGGMLEEKDSYKLEKIQENWKVAASTVLENGPEQAVLWTRWRGKRSWLQLTFTLRRGEDAVQVAGRMLWNERSARLKLAFPSSGPLEMQVPASYARRGQPGHLPCGRWFRRGSRQKGMAFLSDVLSDVDTTPDRVHVTVARASRYADDVPTPAGKDPWLPATDCGELKFRFCLAPYADDLERRAEELLHPPVTLPLPPHPGPLGPSGSLGELRPSQVSLLAARPAPGGKLMIRVQNRSDQTVQAKLVLAGKTHKLGTLKKYEIKTLTLK